MFVVTKDGEESTSPQYSHMKLHILDKMYHEARQQYQKDHRSIPNGNAPPGFKVTIEWRPEGMRQVLIWIPWGPREGMSDGHLPVEITEKPDKVWTLFLPEHETQDSPPQLPLIPRYPDGFFPESAMHDWDWRDGKFYFFTRVTDQPTWVLLEYE